MGKKRVTIALRLSIETGRRKLAGILRCVDERKLDWDIRLRRDGEELLPEDAQAIDTSNTDGIIVSQSHHLKPADRAMTLLAAKTDIPLVAIGMRDHPELAARKTNAAFIEDDVASLGILAAEHFIGQGVLKSYGFVPARGEQVWSILRGAKFAAALKLRGLGCRTYRPPRTASGDRAALVRFLRLLPKPCGILAAYDDRALDVLEAARQAGFSVPDDVSVMGISNDELLCTHASPPLTSIEPDHESQGYAAAELLDRMMNKPADAATPRRPTVLEFPPERIVVRESTAHLTYAGKLVQRALAYVKAHAAEPVGPTDIASALGVSRRLLDLRFRECGQPSMGEILRTERLDLVCSRLRSSEDSIESVTSACGFANAVYAKQLFRERFGMSMRDYRNRRLTAT